jgi:hypothetical protein
MNDNDNDNKKEESGNRRRNNKQSQSSDLGIAYRPFSNCLRLPALVVWSPKFAPFNSANVGGYSNTKHTHEGVAPWK